MACDADVQKATGAAVGFAGPVGFKGKIVVDRAAAHVKNAATGANESDQHFTGVNMGRDWTGDIADIRLATTGDACPNCDGGKLKSYRGIEAGHIFILGTRYSEKMGAQYSDEKQEKKPIVMGCYGIGVSRLVATAIEQNHDENGIKWPMSIAPYQVHLVTLGKEENVGVEAKKLYDDLTARGIDVLWDDRDERPGVKFKDADLLGMPLRITIGAKSLANGNIELKPRTETDPKKAELVPVADASRVVAERIAAAIGSKS
jgi:prolyl-tRNA synthetase